MSALERAQELLAGEVTLPLPLPELAVSVSAAQVFMFSAVTWNRHHIHYSADAARSEGHAGVVVQRALIGNLLARLLTTWLGSAGEIRALSWKVVKSASPGQLLRCTGEVVGRDVRDGSRVLRCALRALNGAGETLAEGTAELELN